MNTGRSGNQGEKTEYVDEVRHIGFRQEDVSVSVSFFYTAKRALGDILFKKQTGQKFKLHKDAPGHKELIYQCHCSVRIHSSPSV